VHTHVRVSAFRLIQRNVLHVYVLTRVSAFLHNISNLNSASDATFSHHIPSRKVSRTPLNNGMIVAILSYLRTVFVRIRTMNANRAMYIRSFATARKRRISELHNLSRDCSRMERVFNHICMYYDC